MILSPGSSDESACYLNGRSEAQTLPRAPVLRESSSMVSLERPPRKGGRLNVRIVPLPHSLVHWYNDITRSLMNF